MSILLSLFRCLRVLHWFYFWDSPQFYHWQHCSLICTTLFHCCHHFFLFLFYLVCQMLHMVLAIVINWILTPDVFILVTMLHLNKVLNFHNEAHTFLYQTSKALIFITLPIESTCCKKCRHYITVWIICV